MVYKIIWTEWASDDLAALVRYIARHNPNAAAEMGYGIYDRVQILADFPEIGSIIRQANVTDLRQLVVRPYRIVYRINHTAKTIEIIRVWHAARGDVEFPKQS